MNEPDWLLSDDTYAMLLFLRGEVEPASAEPDPRHRMCSPRGDLVVGEGHNVKAYQLKNFATECCKRWWDFPLDANSQEIIRAYQQFLSDELTWKQFLGVGSKIRELAHSNSDPMTIGIRWLFWMPTPHGVALLEKNLAWLTACWVHRERIAEMERTATEDDQFAWGVWK